MPPITQHRDDPIPADLLGHVFSFELPTGAIIRWNQSEHDNLGGWTIDLDGNAGIRCVYADGTISGPPRHRVYEELDMPGGEDELHGKPDSEWKRVADLRSELTRQFLMPLDVAWKVAKNSGAANRHARTGETVTVRATGATAEIIDPGTKYDRGNYVRVRYPDGREETLALWRLQLADD